MEHTHVSRKAGMTGPDVIELRRVDATIRARRISVLHTQNIEGGLVFSGCGILHAELEVFILLRTICK